MQGYPALDCTCVAWCHFHEWKSAFVGIFWLMGKHEKQILFQLSFTFRLQKRNVKTCFTIQEFRPLEVYQKNINVDCFVWPVKFATEWAFCVGF